MTTDTDNKNGDSAKIEGKELLFRCTNPSECKEKACVMVKQGQFKRCFYLGFQGTMIDEIESDEAVYDCETLDILAEYYNLVKNPHFLKDMTDEDALDYMASIHVLDYNRKTDMYTNVDFNINDSDAIWTKFWEVYNEHRLLHFESVGAIP